MPREPMNALPRIVRVRQNFPRPASLDLSVTLAAEFEKLRPSLKPGQRIAVGVGSRGISNLAELVRHLLQLLQQAGTVPFLIPAMGSHGGATPEGQRGVIAEYGITEASMGVPIRASLDVRELGVSSDSVPVFCSTDALAADGIILVNRIKPHTDFEGTLGSGLLKMCVIGLGKRAGATAMHQAASRLGHERVIRGMADVLLRSAPILGGLAILENQFHETARLVVLRREDMPTGEDALVSEARALLPLIPFRDIDLLVVDQIGKNISGSGLDPNVTGRGVQGYLSGLKRDNPTSPLVRRLFVRELTPETHGNAIGIGLADVTTTRLVKSIDLRATYVNSLTALTPQSAKIPIYFDTDREAIERIVDSLALEDNRSLRFVRIRDTLSPAHLEISDTLLPEARKLSHLEVLTEPVDLSYDADGNLLPLFSAH